jgi:membrane fusion protein (multidrug efflux system)
MMAPVKILFTLLSIGMMFPAMAWSENAAPSVLIKVEPLRKLSVAETLTTYGSVTPSTGAVINISFPRAGQVARLFIVAGQRVRRGQALLDFATDPNAAALYHQTETTEIFARGELKRVEDLAVHQLATQSQLAAARKALQDAQANLAAQKNIGAGMATQRVNASFKGVVSQLAMQQGDRVPSGIPILQLSKAGKLRATLGVEPEDIVRLRVGMPVQIASVFGNQPAVASLLLQIHGVINPLTRLVDVDVELQDTTSGLLPGMQVRGVIALDSRESWVVPRSAVLRDEQGSFLFQARNGHAVRVPVTAGLESANSVAVSGALESSLKVIVSGNYELQDGMLLRENNP